MTASAMSRASGGTSGRCLNETDGVVSHVAEHAGGHRRQVFRKIDRRFIKQVAQRRQRRLVGGFEALRRALRRPVDLGHFAMTAPQDVRRQSDNRVAPARFRRPRSTREESSVRDRARASGRLRRASPDRQQGGSRRPGPGHHRSRPQSPVRSEIRPMPLARTSLPMGSRKRLQDGPDWPLSNDCVAALWRRS